MVMSPLRCLSLVVIAAVTGLSLGCGAKQDAEKPVTPTKKAEPEAELISSAQVETSIRNGAKSLALSADGNWLIAMGVDGAPFGGAAPDQPPPSKNVEVWDLAKKRRTFAASSATVSVLPVAISPNGKLAAYYNQGSASMVVVDCAEGKELRRLSKSKDVTPKSFGVGLSFSPRGDLLVVASGDDIFGWDPTTGAEKFLWPTGGAEISAASPIFGDPSRIATGDEKGRLAVWDLTTGKAVWQTTASENKIEHLAVSPDGRTLLVAPWLRPFQIRDAATGELRKEIDPRDSVNLWASLSFLPDGKTTVYNSARNQIIFLDLESKRAKQAPSGHSQEMQAIAITGDGKTLATAGKEGSIKIWNVK
jgi:WD40 repeat protein